MCKPATRFLRAASLAALLSAPVTIAGCAAGLEPAPTANAAPGAGDDAARATAAGITVTAMALDRWPGRNRITKELTPMKVRIENNSAKPLLVSYNRIQLVGADGRTYRHFRSFEWKDRSRPR